MIDVNVTPGTYVASVLSCDDSFYIADAMDKFSCGFKSTPSSAFKQYQPNDVIDDERSVRWNREEVARRNKEYDDEVSRLKTVRTDSLKDMNDHLLRVLRSDYDLKTNEVATIWEYAYDRSHSYGYKETLYTFEEVADLYARLKELD